MSVVVMGVGFCGSFPTSTGLSYREPSPYMLLVADVKEEKRAEIPAITHVDGSARIQTVNREENSIYYDLFIKFM